jgi:NADH-quinone oxidoreductase subunit N
VPSAGFVGKLLISRAAIDAGFVWLAVIGVATSAIAAYYYFIVIKTMYMDEPTGTVALSSSHPLAVNAANLCSYCFT